MLSPGLAGQFASLGLSGGGTITGNLVLTGTLQATNLGIGLTPDTTRIHMLSEAADTAPVAFTADDFVVGRSALTGASSGALFGRYDSTHNQAFLGALSPGTAWRGLVVGASTTVFQNASAVAKFTTPGTADDDSTLSSGGQHLWSSTTDATGTPDLGIKRTTVNSVAALQVSDASTGILQIVTQTVASGAANISSANITGTSSGQLGHAQGVPIVAAPGAGYALEFVSGVIINDFATAAYTGGGLVSFCYEAGGATLSATCAYADSVGGAADKIALVAASVPTNNQLVANKGINLKVAAAPTQPGTAAGVLRVKVTYRIHTTGL